MKMRHLVMLLTTAMAGVLSGILWLVPNGLMGGALGMSLAAGAIWLGQRQSAQNGRLTADQVWQAGLASGLVAGVLMAAISEACRRASIVPAGEAAMFGPPRLPFWMPLIMGILYGPIVHWCYTMRFSARRPFWEVHISTCLACLLVKTVAGAAYNYFDSQIDRPAGEILLDSAMLSVLGAVPFAAFWVIVMRITDPAWSLRPDSPQLASRTDV